MGKYQDIFLNNSNVELQVTTALNPSPLLPSQTEHILEHNCIKTEDLVHSSRPNLVQPPLEQQHWKLFTDGSSLMNKGTNRQVMITNR
jgi:hypothetical protein